MPQTSLLGHVRINGFEVAMASSLIYPVEIVMKPSSLCQRLPVDESHETSHQITIKSPLKSPNKKSHVFRVPEGETELRRPGPVLSRSAESLRSALRDERGDDEVGAGGASRALPRVQRYMDG